MKYSRDSLCACYCFLPYVFYSFPRKLLYLTVQVTPASLNKDLPWWNRKISVIVSRAERNAQKKVKGEAGDDLSVFVFHPELSVACFTHHEN